MPFLDLPPQQQERVVCSITAAIKYEVPANLVLAVAEKEGGKPGQWVRNTNGTHDVGPMQFNTYYLQDLQKYGITADDVARAGCYSYDLAAWRLRGHLRNDKHDIWTRAANYHSRTQKYNAIYREDLIRRATKWGEWLESRFATYAVTAPGIAPMRIGQASAISEPTAMLAASAVKSGIAAAALSTTPAATSDTIATAISVAPVAAVSANTGTPTVAKTSVKTTPQYNVAAARALAAVFAPGTL